MAFSLALILTFIVLDPLIFCQTAPDEHSKSAHECFNTVKFSNSNPQVTGSSEVGLQYSNDNFHFLVIPLTCMDLDLYVDISSIKLSLPKSDSHKDYCKDSLGQKHPQCSDSKNPCNCCKVPEKRCTKEVELSTENFDSCVNKQKCNITVKSEFLEECSGREYPCENKKCHSRWVDVVYYCRPKDQVQMIKPSSAGIQLSWWAILLICLGCGLGILVCIYCYNKDQSDKERYGVGAENNNHEMKDDEEGLGNGKCHNTAYRRTSDDIEDTDSTLPKAIDYGQEAYTPNFSRSSTMKSQSMNKRIKQMAVPPPPPPVECDQDHEQHHYSLYRDQEGGSGMASPAGKPFGLSELEQRLQDLASKRNSETTPGGSPEKPPVAPKPQMGHKSTRAF